MREFRYRINTLRVFDPSIPKPPAANQAEDGDEGKLNTLTPKP
jgi:hypothetical protein